MCSGTLHASNPPVLGFVDGGDAHADWGYLCSECKDRWWTLRQSAPEVSATYWLDTVRKPKPQ